MLNNITTFEALYTEAESIQEYVEITPSEDMEEAVMRGNDLVVYIGRTGKMLADAKYHLNDRIQSDVIKMLSKAAKETPNMTSTALNMLVKSVCRDEQYLVDWIERLNRSVTHQMEWCRTIVSKGKEEMRLNNTSKEFGNSKNS